MPPSKEVTRGAVLAAIAAGGSKVPEIVKSTELSITTVNSRVKELQASGDVKVVPQRGRGGSSITLNPSVKSPPRQLAAPPRQGSIATQLPVAVIWVEAQLKDQANASRELKDAGAQAVFDCTGDFDLIALYSTEDAQNALNLARDLATRKEIKGARYGVIVGPAP